MKKTLIILPVLMLFACQKKPELAPSGDPNSVLAAPPMGASVYNNELKKELALLEDLLENRIEAKRLDATIKELMGDRTDKNASALKDNALASLLLTLPELIHRHKNISDNRKLWFKAKLLFLRRRFIEASTLLSLVLKNEPNFIEARNLRARAIFFLGNPDFAVRELQEIIKKSPKNSPENLEALYLIGAIIIESHENDEKRLNTGIAAWNQYLKEADTDKELSAELKHGLLELEKRKNGTVKTEMPLLDPFSPRESYSAHKNAALTAFMKNELLLALELCDKSLKITYDSDVAIVKARIYIKTSRMDEAVELFKNIIEKNSSYAPAFHYRGMAFMLKGQVKEAIVSWQETLKLDPDYARSHHLDQRLAVAQKMLEPIDVESH